MNLEHKFGDTETEQHKFYYSKNSVNISKCRY